MLDFTIIIPAKNEESNILTCLRSIFAINYPREKYEVIVVDNGSNDKTVQLAESSGADVLQLPDVTISALRNYGAKIARGTILVFVDADCTVSEDWLEKAHRYLHRTEIVLFGSPPGIPQNATWVQRTWMYVRGKRNQMVVEVSWLESMNMFVRRREFLKVNGFNEQLVTCEDVDLSYRLSEHGKILSDLRIQAIHHGEAQTLLEFFRKEKWRGKSNYAGILAHGFRISELPSLLLPIYYFLAPLLTLIISVCLGSLNVFVLGVLLWQLPLLLLVFIKIKNKATLIRLLRLWLLYNIYYAARAISII